MASFVPRTHEYEPTGRFTPDSGEANEVWTYVPDAEDSSPITAQNVRDKIQEILGNTTIYGNGGDDGPPVDGKLQRNLPKACDMYPWLVADSVSVEPVKYDIYRNENAPAGLEVTTLGQGRGNVVPVWNSFNYHIHFSDTKYPIHGDGDIIGSFDSWYDDDGNFQEIKWYEEWQRYTEIQWQVKPDTIKAKTGNQVLYDTGGKQSPYEGTPFWYLPNRYFKLIWYYVPYRYLSNPAGYLHEFVGRVNYSAWTLGNYTYGPGELLYLGADAMSAKPAIGRVDPRTQKLSSWAQICHIAMSFVATSRDIAVPVPDPFIFNKNWIANGHNLLPRWDTRKFYYGFTEPPDHDPAKRVPTYLSAPLQMLFKDPEVPINA